MQSMKQYEDYIQNSGNIGIITMFFMHNEGENHRCNVYWVRLLLFILFTVQVIVPAFLFWIQLDDYLQTDLGFCPEEKADKTTRTLAFCVGGIYISRVFFLLAAKKIEDDPDKILQKGEQGGMLQLYIELDRFMNTSYEAVVYILNLGVVFMVLDPFNSVLSALAIEFIIKLDDEVMESYRKLFPAKQGAQNELVVSFVRANNDRSIEGIHGQEQISCFWLSLTKIIRVAGEVTYYGACLGIAASTIYLPLCKPASIDAASS